MAPKSTKTVTPMGPGKGLKPVSKERDSMAEEKLFDMSLPATLMGCYLVIKELSEQEGSPLKISDVGIPNQDEETDEMNVSIGKVPEIMGLSSGSISLVRTAEYRTWVRFYKTTELPLYIGAFTLNDTEKQGLADRAITDAQGLVEAAYHAFEQRVKELKMVDSGT